MELVAGGIMCADWSGAGSASEWVVTNLANGTRIPFGLQEEGGAIVYSSGDGLYRNGYIRLA